MLIEDLQVERYKRLINPDELKANQGPQNDTFHLVLIKRPFMQAAGGRFQVHALHERFAAQQRLLAGVQLLGLVQPVSPGGGHLDPVGPHRQRVGRVETQEGQTPEGEDRI